MAEKRDFENNGVMIFNSAESALRETRQESATIIISGLARSGTSMVAQVLRTAGIYLGAVLDDTVNEDVEVSQVLTSRDRSKMRELIATRNKKHDVWGFKRPNIHELISVDDFHLFRKPQLILSFRDPIAIAKRNVVAELIPETVAFTDAVESASRFGIFASKLSVPLLVASYEKAIFNPELFVDSLISFCRLSPSEETRSEMIAGVEPAPKHYAAKAALHFEGHVDEIDSYEMLTGWCRQMYSSEPVSLTLLADGQPVTNFPANAYREDLERAGFGNGCHAFRVSLRELSLSEGISLAVQVQGRTFRLVGSDRTVSELRPHRR